MNAVLKLSQTLWYSYRYFLWQLASKEVQAYLYFCHRNAAV